MLLSAEASLELERQERLKLRDQLEDLRIKHENKEKNSPGLIKVDATTNTFQTDEPIGDNTIERTVIMRLIDYEKSFHTHNIQYNLLYYCKRLYYILFYIG